MIHGKNHKEKNLTHFHLCFSSLLFAVSLMVTVGTSSSALQRVRDASPGRSSRAPTACCVLSWTSVWLLLDRQDAPCGCWTPSELVQRLNGQKGACLCGCLYLDVHVADLSNLMY